MAVLDKILKKLKPEEDTGEDFIEVNPVEEEGRVNVNIESLNSYSDTERIQSLVRGGSVVFLRIRELREKDINELKKAIDKLKKTCTAMNGDIVGVDEDFIIITPQFARIYRGKAA
jgi:SepF-like predicted cell division protein (DUF552 family)